MSVFKDATDLLFNDPNFSDVATFTSQSDPGSPIAIRVTFSLSDSTADGSNSVGIVKTARFKVRTSDIDSLENLRPAKGDMISFRGNTYRLNSSGELDRLNLIWKVTANPINASDNSALVEQLDPLLV